MKQVPAEFAANDGRVVVLAVQVDLFHAIKIPSRHEVIKIQFKGLLCGSPGGVAAETKSYAIYGFIEPFVKIVNNGWMEGITLYIVVNPIKVFRINGDLDDINFCIIVKHPAIIGIHQYRKDEQNEKRLYKAYFHLMPRKNPYEYGGRFKAVSAFSTKT